MLLQTDMRALIFIVAWVHVLLHQEAVQYVGCCVKMKIYLESTMAQEMVLLLIMEMESTLTIFI